MKRTDSTAVDYYQIGEVAVSLATPIRTLRKQYAALYQGFNVPACPANAVRIEVQPTSRSLRHRRRYEISVNGRARFAPSRFDEVLPYVEWAVNWELAEVLPRFLQLHASSLEVHGEGLILPGISGSGKSTLTAGLLARGWRYLCDEFALIDTQSLMIHPYPRAICIKAPGFGILKSLGVSQRGVRHFHKGTKGSVRFVSSSAFGSETVGAACPVRFVVFPKYAVGRAPLLVPMSRAEAAFELHAVCFNLFNSRSCGSDLLAEIVRNAGCFRLISGGLRSTVALLEDLVGNGADGCAQSA